MSDFLRDNGAGDPNPGMSAAFPDVAFAKDLDPSDFTRGPIVSGHARQSPGDYRADKEAAPDNQAQMGASQLGSGVLPTPAMNIQTEPISADFARGIGRSVPGSARPSPSNPDVRAPLSPAEALGLSGVRIRGDMLQSDLQPSAMRGGDFPDTAERDGNGDNSVPENRAPQFAEYGSTAGPAVMKSPLGHVAHTPLHRTVMKSALGHVAGETVIQPEAPVAPRHLPSLGRNVNHNSIKADLLGWVKGGK